MRLGRWPWYIIGLFRQLLDSLLLWEPVFSCSSAESAQLSTKLGRGRVYFLCVFAFLKPRLWQLDSYILIYSTDELTLNLPVIVIPHALP